MFLKQKSPTLYVGDPNLLKNTVFVAPTGISKAENSQSQIGGIQVLIFTKLKNSSKKWSGSKNW